MNQSNRGYNQQELTRFFFYLIVISNVIACKSSDQDYQNSSKVRAFAVAEIGEWTRTNSALRSFDRERPSLRYNVKIAVTPKNARRRLSNPYHRKMLQIDFDPMTDSDFLFLRDRFGRSSQIKYSATARYQIRDFLPPMVQATLGQVFEIEFGHWPSEKMLSSNCWGTAYEFARNNSDQFMVFYADSPKVMTRLIDPAYSMGIISPISIGDFSTQTLKFGDVVLFSTTGRVPSKETVKWLAAKSEDAFVTSAESVEDDVKFSYHLLEHAAIYIIDDIFYEKTGNSSAFTYRLVTLGTLKQRYKGVVSARRFNQPNRLPTPTAEDGFLNPDDVSQMIFTTVDSSGRSILTHSASELTLDL